MVECILRYVLDNPEWFTALISAIGLWFVYVQLRASRLQITLSNYSEYTRRYSEIVARFPEEINEASFVLKERKDYRCIMRVMRQYFDLSFEEYDLHKKKFIEERIWLVWKGGIRTAMGKPAFQQAWVIIKNDSEFGKEFEALIEELKISKS